MTVSSIGTNSRDYATIALWWADAPLDLVATADTWEGEMYNDSEFVVTTQIAFSGVTANATFYPELRCAIGESFTDNIDKLTNKLRYDVANGVGIRTTNNYIDLIDIDNSFFKFTGIQVKAARKALLQNESTSEIRSCVLEARHGETVRRAYSLVNCLIINIGDSPAIINNYVSGNHFNCTIVSTGGGATGVLKVGGGADGTVVKNCAIFGFTSAMSAGSWGVGTDYNATDNATLPAGSNNQVNLIFSDQFEDISSSENLDLRAVSTGSLDENGIRDQVNTNDLDIVGQARSITTPTIGAWEVVSGAGPTILFDGDISGQSDIIGSLNILKSISSNISSVSDVTGSLSILKEISGAVDSTSNVTGEIDLSVSLISDISASSDITGSLTIKGAIDLGGSVSSISNVQGSLTASLSLAGDISSASNIIGSLTVEAPGEVDLSGSISSASNITGSIDLQISLSSSIESDSDITGALTVTGQGVIGIVVNPTIISITPKLTIDSITTKYSIEQYREDCSHG